MHEWPRLFTWMLATFIPPLTLKAFLMNWLKTWGRLMILFGSSVQGRWSPCSSFFRHSCTFLLSYFVPVSCNAIEQLLCTAMCGQNSNGSIHTTQNHAAHFSAKHAGKLGAPFVTSWLWLLEKKNFFGQTKLNIFKFRSKVDFTRISILLY